MGHPNLKTSSIVSILYPLREHSDSCVRRCQYVPVEAMELLGSRGGTIESVLFTITTTHRLDTWQLTTLFCSERHDNAKPLPWRRDRPAQSVSSLSLPLSIPHENCQSRSLSGYSIVKTLCLPVQSCVSVVSLHNFCSQQNELEE